MKNNFNEAEKFRYLVLAVQRQGNRLYKGYLKDIDITPSKAEVISVLKKMQPITLKNLGQLLICEDGSPSRLVDRMVKDQLVERVKDQKDSRYVRLALTSLGEEKHSQILKAEAEMYKMLGEIYTKEELQIINKKLNRLLEGSPLAETFNDRGL